MTFETEAQGRGALLVTGVDEVGRGPLAGPVVAAAVILNPSDLPELRGDSKAMSARARDLALDRIMDTADVSVAEASVGEIDEMNILQASMLAMRRAVLGLRRPPDFALIDGNRLPRDLPCPGAGIVKGDTRSLSIAAASVVAKVTRDRIMVELAQQYPGYGWDRNAGYPTKAHLQALRDFGVTPHHRRSFRPVHNILCREKSVTP